jgi:hypothetical protein
MDYLTGIKHERTAPYTPQQNGVSERANRTIMEAARSMYVARNLPNELRAEAVAYATYIQNKILSTNGKTTSFEIVHGSKPDVSHLRIFGSTAFIHVPEAIRHKLDPKAVEGIFVGCCLTTKAYRIWVPSRRRIEISRNVILHESNQQMQDKKPVIGTPFDSFLLQDQSTEGV